MLVDAIDLKVQNVVHVKLNGCTQLGAFHDQNVLLIEFHTAGEDMKSYLLKKKRS